MVHYHLKSTQVCIQLYVARTQFQFQVMTVDFQILPSKANKNIPVEFQLVPRLFFLWQPGISLQEAEICTTGTHAKGSPYSCQKTSAALVKVQQHTCILDSPFPVCVEHRSHQGNSHPIQMRILASQMASTLLREHILSVSQKKRSWQAYEKEQACIREVINTAFLSP